VEIHLGVEVEFPEKEHGSVEISLSSSVFSFTDLSDVSGPEYTLWRGLTTGSHDSVAEAKQILETSEIQIVMRELSISKSISSFDKDEIILLGNQTRSIMNSVLSPAFSQQLIKLAN